MGRLWQTLILSRWNPIFTNTPVESLIYQNQKAYYEPLQMSTDRTDSAPFIEFILQMILDAILSSTDTAQDTAHATISSWRTNERSSTVFGFDNEARRLYFG